MIEIMETLVISSASFAIFIIVCLGFAYSEAKRKGISLKEELFNEDED